MTIDQFNESITRDEPPQDLSIPLTALWWDAKGEWKRAHDLVDELETPDGIAVHAYLHRKNGEASNARYWYGKTGRDLSNLSFEAEWQAVVSQLLEAR